MASAVNQIGYISNVIIKTWKQAQDTVNCIIPFFPNGGAILAGLINHEGSQNWKSASPPLKGSCINVS